MIPVKGGIRRSRKKTPQTSSSGDQTVIKYNTSGVNIGSPAGFGGFCDYRYYAPGFSGGLASTIGSDLVNNYSSAKFLPGTSIRWEPSVAFTVSGRVVVGFTDNPETIAALSNAVGTYQSVPNAGNFAVVATAVKSLGSVISFPVWQETNVPFPTRLRRKRFDCNNTSITGVDTFDRSVQTAMFYVIEGCPASTSFGSWWYRDVVDAEGLHNVVV